MKTLVKIAVVIIVLLIAAAVTLYLTVDLLAKAGIESGGTYSRARWGSTPSRSPTRKAGRRRT
jgi:hypothetical protein